jgi:hypothetical protein
MNRKKKLNDALNKRLKKMNAKLRVSNKPKYIAKADRENTASAPTENTGNCAAINPPPQ